MDGAPQSYFDRLECGIAFRGRELPARRSSVAEVDPRAEVVQFQRTKASHRGLGACSAIRTLLAYDVDQAFLDEIVELADLRTLYLERVTATDLSVLGRLHALERLVIHSPTRIDSFDWAASLAPSLRALAVENARRVRELDALAGLAQLRTLAVEGSLHSAMRVASLEPLRGLHALEALFLTALRVEDRRLAPLASLRNLRLLEFADYYAEGEIDTLAQALPTVRCAWFEPHMRKHRWEVRGLKRGR